MPLGSALCHLLPTTHTIYHLPHNRRSKMLEAALEESAGSWEKDRIRDYLRITIGSMQEMQALECAIEMIFGRA